MNYGFYGSVMTVVMLATFVGIVAWVLGADRDADFDAAARVPLEDDAQADASSRRERA